MSRKNSLVYNPGHTGNQTPTERSTSFCAECREKLLSWGAFERNAISFHRDIDELIGCGKQCELCNYICNLFGTHQLEDYLARAIEYNNKPAEPLGPDAANTIVYHNDGHRSLYLLSRDPKTTPTVDIRYDVRNSFLDSHGHLDHVTVQVIPCHHVTKRDDRRAFLLYTEAGRAFRRSIWSDKDPTNPQARSATIREWLTECETYHPGCRKPPVPEGPLAARVIAIQKQGTEGYSIKLLPTQGIDLHNEPHVVLSHVWGGIDLPCKTTSKNIAKYHDIGIDFKDLPKTFQDAVRTTASLDFQYLWIDSLCIIQDDEEDWERESAKMAAIFRAGTITLSASSASNGHGGCGLSPKFSPVTRFCGTESEGFDFAIRETVVFGKGSTDILKDQLRNAPVNKRAWILQEKMLSRRIVHATYSQFVWQCNVFTESEDGTIYDQKAPGSVETNQRNVYQGLLQGPDDANIGQDTYEFDWRWWKCAAEYSSRSLTVASDQYAALAGVVQLHQELSGDRPVVGLWERHLPLHLAWEVLRNPREHSTSLLELAHRRPSWTWMSFRHGSVKVLPTVRWSHLLKDKSTTGDLGIVYQAQVLSTNIRWSGQPLASDPSGSTICIRGIMRRMPKPEPVRWGVRSPLHLDPDVTEPSSGHGEYDTFALFAYVRSAALTNQAPVVTTVYLIVQALEAQGKDVYTRIGRMQLTEDFDMSDTSYLPEGVGKVITLV